MRLRLALSCLVAVAAGAGSPITPPPAAAADPLPQFHCGEHIRLTFERRVLPDDVPRIDLESQRKAGKAANIILNAGPTLQANGPALAAWNDAVDEWESIISDPVTVVIDADLAALGPGILGSTGSSQWQAGYATIRNAIVADAAGDESVATQLPTLAQFNVAVPPGSTFPDQLSATKANLRALGFDMGFDDPNPDATITFSTDFPFDYDRSDGITPGEYDFHGIAFHELGHALGFVSEVDDADYFVDQGTGGNLRPTPLDMYRLLPGVAATNFTGGTRQIVPGSIESNTVNWDGSVDLRMSTGRFTGDGRQASHWKANELTGTYLGVMDPTGSAGELLVTTANDVRMFGLIGWDVVNGITDCNNNGVDDADDISNGTSQDCNNNGVPDECDLAGGGSVDIDGDGIPDECEADCDNNGLPDDYEIAEGLKPDCNANGVPDGCDLSSGTSQDVDGNSVPDECQPDCNENGVPDSFDISQGTSIDCNFNGIPDECDIASGTSTDVNGNGIADDCEPDCNNNDIPDSWDISQGTSQDCNANNVPDECDISSGSSADANANSVPDECETDCNNNGVPDDFDISQGTSSDANSNGVPDECDPDCNDNNVPDDLDIAAQISQDCNENGIPDECDMDCNLNQIPDACDISSGTSQDVDGNGIPDECAPTGIDGTPELRYRAQAVPNPFNPATTIRFEMADPGRARVHVYDVAGRRVRTLVDGEFAAGVHETRWDGRSGAGSPVSSGVYYVVYTGNGNTTRLKLTLVK